MAPFSEREKLLKYANSPTQKGLSAIEKERSIYTKVDKCDDRYNIYIKVENGYISKARFDGDGCIIASAAVEAIMKFIEKKSVSEVSEFIYRYIDFVNGKINIIDKELMVFKIVQTHKSRRKCALASIDVIRKVIENE